jgi:hemoglobin-like flavoprotein
MTPHQQEYIRSSWGQVAPIADTAALLFYDRLFELDPGLRPMFAHTDMPEQRTLLMQVLAVVVASIDKLDTLIPAVEALGRRHAGYGVKPGDYATVGRALLDTLQTGLGDGFTPEVEAAWTEAYELLAGVMLAATSSEEKAA